MVKTYKHERYIFRYIFIRDDQYGEVWGMNNLMNTLFRNSVYADIKTFLSRSIVI